MHREKQVEDTERNRNLLECMVYTPGERYRQIGLLPVKKACLKPVKRYALQVN